MEQVMNVLSASWFRIEKKHAIAVFVLACTLISLIPLLSLPSYAAEEKPETGELSPDQFKGMSPEDQLKHLQSTYNNDLATLFYDDKNNIGKDPQLDLRYFNTPSNALKNFESSKIYFQRPNTLQQARDGAQAFFQRAYQANYVFDASATNLVFNEAAGTLSSGGKTIKLGEYANNKKILQIRAVNDDFEITEAPDAAGKEKTITFSGTAPAELSYKDGRFSLKNPKGEIQTVQPVGSSRFALQQDGTLTIEGAAKGTLTVNGVPREFLIRERLVDSDDAPSLTIHANGDIATGVKSDVELNTPTLYLDGNFLITGSGKEVYTYALGGKQGSRKGVDADDQETNGETVLVDKTTGIGVVGSGQDRGKNEFVLTHLDQYSSASALVPPKIRSVDEARQRAEGIRRQPEPSGGKSAEVFIKRGAGATTVYSRGKVMVRNYFVDGQGQVVGANENKAAFKGDSASSTFDFVSDALTPPARAVESFIVSGEGTYTDKNYRAETEQSGAVLKKIGNDAFLTVACTGCQNGNAAKIVKNIAVVSAGGEITGDDIRRQSLEITADVRGGKIEFDVSAAALKGMNDALDADDSSFLAFDSPLYLGAEGENTYFGIGAKGLGRYEQKISGKTQAVSIVMNGKSMLGQPQEIKTGIDVALLGNEKYRGHLQQSFSLQDRAEAQARSLAKQFNIRVAADGSCLDKACSVAMKNPTAALVGALNDLQKTNIQASNELNRALLVSAQNNGEDTIGIKKAIRKNEALAKKIDDQTNQIRQQAIDAATYAARLKNDPLKAEKIGNQLRSLDVIIRGRDRKLGQLQELAATSRDVHEVEGALRQIKNIEAHKKRLEEQRAQLEGEKMKLIATQADPATRAKIAIATIGVRAGIKQSEAAFAESLVADVEKNDPQQAALMRYELAFKKEISSEAQRDNAQRYYAQVIEKGTPLQKAQVEKLRGELVEKPLLDAEIERLRNAHFGAVVDEETGVRITTNEETRTGEDLSVVLASYYFLMEAKTKREKEGEAYSRGQLQAAQAARVALDKGVTLDEWTKLPPEQRKSLVGDVPLGDATFHRHAQFLSQKVQGKITPQQEFNVMMARAEDTALVKGDYYDAKEDVAAIREKFASQSSSIQGFRELVKLEHKIDEATLRLGISDQKSVDVLGVSVPLSFDVSKQKFLETSAQMVDITTVVDLPIVGSVIAVKGINAAVKLAKAGKFGRRLEKAAELYLKAEKAANVFALQKVPAGAVKSVNYVGGSFAHVVPEVAGVVARPVVRAGAFVAKPLARAAAPIAKPVAAAAAKIARPVVQGVIVAARPIISAGKSVADVALTVAGKGASAVYTFATQPRGWQRYVNPTVYNSKLTAIEKAERTLALAQKAGDPGATKLLAQEVADLKTVEQAEKALAQNRGLRGTVRGVTYRLDGATADYHALQKQLTAFEAAKKLGNDDVIRATAKEVAKRSEAYNKARDVEQLLDAAVKAKLEKLEKEQLLKQIGGTPSPEAVAEVFKSTDAAAANLDEIIAIPEPLKRCASPCKLTDTGKRAAQIVGIDEEGARVTLEIIDEIEEAAETTAIARGRAIMDDAPTLVEVTPAGSSRALAGGVPEQTSIEGLEAAAGLAPRNVPTPHYQARAEIERDTLVDAIKAFSTERTDEEIARSIARVVRMPESLPPSVVVDTQLVNANVGRLAEGPFEELKNGVKRYQLWVNRETGKIGAVGRFDQVGEIATDPSHINIVIVETFGKVETPVNLENYLSPEARQALLDTMSEFERKVPDVIAGAPPPKSLEKIPVTRAERPRAKETDIGLAETQPDIVAEEPTRVVPKQTAKIAEPDAAPTNKGYASRREILDDVKSFTRFLDDNEFRWAVSGSGGIADELAAVGQRTGDADILISSSRWKSLDEALRQRQAAGTLEEIGIREYKPMYYNPASPRPGVRYETTAKGSVVLTNGQEIDLLGGMGYGVTDEGAIRRGFLEIAPGIRAPVELSPIGEGYRAVFFDLDEFGNPSIPTFFKKGEDGRQFMTLDALHAKYSFEKRPERVAFVEGLLKKAQAAVPAPVVPPEKTLDVRVGALQKELASTKIADKFTPSRVKVTKKISGDGQSIYELSGTYVDARGFTIGGFDKGESFSHTLFVNENEGTAILHRTFSFTDKADPDGTLIAKVLAAEEERLAPVLRQMGFDEYLTYPKHDLELVTVCRIHPCAFDAPIATVMSDVEKWLGSADGARYLETGEGKAWLETNRKKGFVAWLKRSVGLADEIDGNKVGMAAANYPDAFLRGKKYPVRVDVSQAPEQALKDAVTAPFEVTPPSALKDIQTESLDVSEGALLEAAEAVPVPKKTTLAERTDISDTVKDELERLGVKDISDIAPAPARGTPKTLSSAVAPDSLLGKLDSVGAGFSKARRVELADGRIAVWKIDTSNPITANLQHGKVLGVTDGGRRQLGMAGILNEFDTVVVPRMRRLQTVDGYGIIESEFIDGYTSLGKEPSKQFRRLDDMLRTKEITSKEYSEIVSQAQEQGVVNLMFGNGDVELGFVKLQHADGADPSTYVRLVRFDEEFAFQGLLDYPLLHQTAPWLGLEKLMSSGNDQILGMFIRDDFITAAKTIDIEKLRRRFTPIAKKLEGIVADEAGFIGNLRRAGYQEDEARTILSGARKRAAQLKQELETGAPGNLHKLIDNNGELLATADGGFISKSERLTKQLPQQPLRSRPRADYAKHDPDRVVEFVPREKLMATRMAGVSSFDYDSLQAMNILGISPEVARTRDVRRIGAAYREEVGLLDAGDQTPQLAKLVEEGALTPQEYVQLRKGAPMMMGGPTQEDLEKILIPFFENPVKVGEVRGLEGEVSTLYDRVGRRNLDDIFQLHLESLGPDIYGGKAVVYIKDDGMIAVAFMTETAKTHHRHALANIISGEKAQLVYDGLYQDPRIADLPERAFGFEFLFDKKKGKIIDIKHRSQVTSIQIGKGVTGWRLNENILNTVEQGLLNKIDPELFDESFFEKDLPRWINRKELPISPLCP